MQIDVNGIKITLTDQQLKEIADQQKKSKTKEERFLELISGIDINQPKVDFQKYPNTLFWFDKDGKYICEYDWKNGYFYLSYGKVWSVFESEFSLNYQEIRTFLNGMVEEHFKLKGVTTESLCGDDGGKVEEHFKLKGVTTHNASTMSDTTVEEHFKLKGVTTRRILIAHPNRWKSTSN